jgi:hypothetical protein
MCTSEYGRTRDSKELTESFDDELGHFARSEDRVIFGDDLHDPFDGLKNGQLINGARPISSARLETRWFLLLQAQAQKSLVLPGRSIEFPKDVTIGYAFQSDTAAGIVPTT